MEQPAKSLPPAEVRDPSVALTFAKIRGTAVPGTLRLSHQCMFVLLHCCAKKRLQERLVCSTAA